MTRIAFLNSFNESGGAAKSARRLFNCLKNHNELDLKFFSQENEAPLKISIAKIYDKLPLIFDPKYRGIAWSNGLSICANFSDCKKFDPDIIHLHWINRGFVGIEDIFNFNKPIVWTLHDSWPFTGGCHIPGECFGYERSCGHCPSLMFPRENDLSYQNLKRKMNYWAEIKRMSIIAPSEWLANKARRSSLFKDLDINVIPNGVDLEQFKPLDRSVLRKKLGFKEDDQIILAGAMSFDSDVNKGGDLFTAALFHLQKSLDRSKVKVLVFGNKNPVKNVTSFEWINLGVILNENKLRDYYSVADAVCVPSRYESFCQVALESLACGTPVVAFDSSGPKEIINHGLTGYLAKSFDAYDFSKGVLWCLNTKNNQKDIAEHVLKFDIQKIAATYAKIYQNG